MRMLRLTVVLGAVLAAGAALADRIDDFVRSELARQHIPGAWVMVRKDGRLLKVKGYGVANLEDGTPVTPETRMQTGSIGKMFTATGILLLVRDGKLSLDDSLAKFFPGSPEWWRPITIRHLLSHTGGVPDYEGEKYSVDLKRDYTEDELIRFAQTMSPDFAPGEKWSYSNTDYMILGVLIHRLTGQFYVDFLRDRVWRPNGLPTMRSINDREVIPHRAAGYDWDGHRWLNQDWVSATLNSTADGTLYATPADFEAWDRALEAYAVLPKPLQDEMWTPVKLNDGSATTYGYGWQAGDRYGHRFVGHTGAWQGFTSIYLRFPDDHVSVAVFTNRSGADVGALGLGVASRCSRIPAKEDLRPIPSNPDETAAVRRLILGLRRGAPPEARASREFAALPAADLEAIGSTVGPLGELKALDLVYRNPAANGDQVYRASFERGRVWIRFTRNASGAIVSARVG